MPQPKRRKLSLDEQDGKESEKNRTAALSDEGIEKQSGSSGQAKESCHGLQTQSDKRIPQSKSERKAEGTAVSSSSSMVASVEDAKDGAGLLSTAGDGCERVSSSGRVIRQTNKGRCFTAALEAAQNKQATATVQGVVTSGHPSSKATVGKSATPIRRKRGRKRRSWDVWCKFEQDAFFEGLFEHGKDFDAIHNLLVFRSKKRGIDTALIKTKEQVRHLYYRMWQKISKHVEMGNNVKKEAQEIYGLVNYYAIRKVFKRMDQRAVEHLNELILKGVSKVRENSNAGKRNRKKLRILRTPVCNALKKLNNIEESKEEYVSNMPQQVTVELTPRSSAAWLKVHGLSHNPRVRFHLSVNRSLACLLEHLKKKWKGPNDRLRSGLGENEEEDELVVYPHHTYTLEPLTLAPQRATSVDLITFSSYRDNMLSSPPAGSRSAKKGSEDNKPAAEILSDGDGHAAAAAADHPKPRCRSAKKGSEDQKQAMDIATDGDGHGTADNPKAVGGDHPKPVKSSAKINLLLKLSADPMVQVAQPPCEDENAMFPDAPLFSPPAKEEAGSVGDCNTMENSCATNSTCDSEEQKAADPSPDNSPHSKEKVRDWREEERATDMRRLVESATKGFTQQSSKLVTLARLSLMLGKTDHLRLEYDWRPKWPAVGGPAPPAGIVGEVERLTNMLRRLSNLANLEYRDLMQKAKMMGVGKMSQCTLCGHLLDKATTRKKMTSDMATETDPLPEEGLGGVSMMQQPAQLNSNGTLVSMASKSSFLSPLQAPDTDGVFRVPMPIAVPMSVRGMGSPGKMSAQPSASQLNRPPENYSSRLSYLVPRKRRPKRKPVVCQRTLLPKMQSTSLIFLPQNVLQPLPGATTTPTPTTTSSSTTVQPESLQPGLSPMILQPVTQQTEVAMDMNAAAAAVSAVMTSVLSTEMTTVPSPIMSLSLGATSVASTVAPSVSSTVTSVQTPLEVDTGVPAVSVANLKGDNSVSSSDLFGCGLDMPVVGSPDSSPNRSTQQLISSSVSPPSLSSIFDISLPAPSSQAGSAGDKFLEMVADGNSGFSSWLKSPPKVGSSLCEVGHQPVCCLPPHTLSTPQQFLNTPPHSIGSPPQRSPLKSGAETRWLGEEVPELSLSGFGDSPVKKGSLGENGNSMDLQAHTLSLSHFLQSSSAKKSEAIEGVSIAMPTLSVPSTSSGALSSSSFIPAPPSLFGESSQDSLVARLDMDTALQSVMIESSIDYSTKFEKLAEHLIDNADASQPNI